MSGPFRLITMAALAASLGGCFNSQTGFDAPDPTARLNAIVQATDTDDRSKIPDLIEQLDSDDPAARLLAIRGLERMTGQTLGYEYDAPEWERIEAISRWEQWYAGSGTDPRGEGGPSGQVSAMR